MARIQNEDGVLQQLMRQQIGVVFGFARFTDQPRHDIGGIVNALGAPAGNQRLEIGQKIPHRMFAVGELGGVNFRFQRTKDGK